MAGFAGTTLVPVGGRGRSGFGVTRGAEGLLEMTAVKTVTISRGKFRPAYQPLGPKSVPWLLGCLRLVHGRGWIRRFRRLPKPT